MLFRAFILTSLVIGLVSGLVASTGCDGCDGGGFPPDGVSADAQLTGTVSLAFSLTDLQGAPITCEQVAANTVFAQLRSRTAASGDAVSLSCASGGGTSQQIAIGAYDVTFQLNGFNTTLATASPAVVIIRPNQNTALSPVTFRVDATGGLAFSLAAPPATSNCKAPAQGGAGITTMTITLVHTGDGCAPVTFNRTRGAMPVGAYVVNCSSPMVVGCIENDEVLTLATTASGAYTIHIRGRINDPECWQNDDTVQVPPKSQVLTTTLNLGFQIAIPGCRQ